MGVDTQYIMSSSEKHENITVVSSLHRHCQLKEKLELSDKSSKVIRQKRV